MGAAPLYQLPPASIVGREVMADGAHIRTLLIPHDQPVGRLLMLTGRADFLEKWAETFIRFHEAGFAVASFDWRGQGESTRLTDNGAGYIDSFDTWLADLDQLSGWALNGLGAGPWLALGHSMGGHLLTRWLADPARHALPLRRQIRAVVLSSPFFGLGMPWPMRAAVLGAAPVQVARGLGADFAWGQRPYGPAQRSKARSLLLTGSRHLFAEEGRWIEANPSLATGGVSWGWLDAFFRSQASLEALPLEQLDLPILMLLAAREHLVDNVAATRVAARLPDCQRRLIPGAAHELLREVRPLRTQILARITSFAREHLA